MEIRRYRDEDEQSVWRLHNLALKGTGAHAGDGPWDDDLHAIPQVYLATGGEFVVGIEDGQIVAMGALMTHSNSTAEIKRMRVHPDYQRRGFGQKVLDALEERAISMGINKLILDTTSIQEAARAFYQKNGYHLVRTTHEDPFLILHYEKDA